MTARAEIPLELIADAVDGAPGAADRLVAAAWPHAFRIAYSIVRDRASAEDAAQESCAIAYQYIGRLRAPEAFRVWFYRIVMRQATRLERKTILSRALEWTAGFRSDLSDALVRVDILAALAKLSGSQRAAILLHYYADLTSREIGEVLDMPDSSVRFHIMQAKRKLEVLLGEHRFSAMEGIARAL